jgi:hypothetical protein
MARGWESKSVESQQDSAAAARAARYTDRVKTPDRIECESKRSGLLLSRKRVLHDLETTTHPRYRQQLEQALAYLDDQLAQLDSQLSSA